MAHFDLFNEMDLLRREVDNTFRNFALGPMSTPTFLPGSTSGDYPRLNISSNENNLYIEALMPGIRPEDLELSVMQNTLTLSGERKADSDDDNNGERTWHRRERGIGRFMRTIELPTSVDTSKVDALCHDGILAITLPKAEHLKARKISVSAN